MRARVKRYQKLNAEGRAFLAEVRATEQRMFATLLDPEHPRRLLSTRRSWDYRPSHHVSRGLVGAADLAALSVPGRRLLSVGAYPACLETLLCALGVPRANVVVADRDPAIARCALENVVFDLFDPWPELGSFDLILFPESLSIGVGDRVAEQASDAALPGPFPNDALAARLLAHVLGEARDRLAPGGEVRADGPMSHPNVVRAVSAALDAAARRHHLDYDRFFLRLRATDGPSECRFD